MSRMPGLASRERRLDEIFGALANGERRRMLRQLRRGPMATPEIAARFDFSKQALSRHLSVLESAGLIERSTQGRLNYVSLVPSRLHDVSAWIAELRRGWHGSLDRLDFILRGSHER
jgi:DNA-binding transcriptional ArsR family regulator